MLRRKGALIFGIWVSALILMSAIKEETMLSKIVIIFLFISLFFVIYFINLKGNINDYMISGRFIVFLLVVFFTASVNFELASNNEGRLKDYIGKEISIKGKVLSIVKDEENNHQFIMKISGEKLLVKNFSYKLNLSTFVGRNVKIKGRVEKPDSARNPGCFDYKEHLKSKKIYSILDSKKNEIKILYGGENRLLIYCEAIRQNFKKNLYAYFDEEIAGMIVGMSLGEKSGIDSELYDKFQKNGICHILAVSGLHIGALYSFLNILGNKKKNIFINIMIVMVLFFYVALSNFAPSIIRAFLMIILHMLSILFKKRYDMFTAGFFTMFIMTLFNPLLIENIGFQLSFCAIITLAVLLPNLARLSKNIISGSIAMQLGMAPYSAYVFNYFSISAFFLNIPVIFLAGILVPLIMIMLIISELGSFLSLDLLNFSFMIVGIIAEFLSRLILFLNDFAFWKIRPFFQVTSPSLESLFFYYTVLFFISSEFFRILWQRKQWKRIAVFVLSLSMLAFFCGKIQESEFDKAELIFCDVGQGDCLLVRKEGKNILLDTGGSIRFDVGEKILTPFLLKNGVSHLDMVVISHFDKDHVGGLKTLNENIRVDKIAIYEANCVIPKTVEEKTGVSGDKYFYMAAGDEYVFSKKLKIKILFPFRDKVEVYKVTRPNIKDENLISLVAKVEIDGISVLMTGDLDFTTEDMLVSGNTSDNLKSDILKVSHHGSRYGSSEKLLNAVMPKIAVIQVGKNNYGHPSEEAIERLKNAGAVIFRNDKNGAIGIDIMHGKKIKPATML